MKSNILSKGYTLLFSVIAIVNIVCGLFWAKGFYRLGPFLAWGSIISLFFLFGGKVIDIIKGSGLKQKLRDMLDDDVSPKPAKKEVKKEKETIPSKDVLSRAEYERRAKKLLEEYESAQKEADEVLMEELRSKMDELKKKEPPKVEIDRKKELEDLRKIMGV